MSLILDPTNPVVADRTTNDEVIGEGEAIFETNMPAGAAWTSDLTVKIEIQSPYPGDETQWETLYTFTNKGTWSVNMIGGRKYRVVASAVGPWVHLNISKRRWTK